MRVVHIIIFVALYSLRFMDSEFPCYVALCPCGIQSDLISSLKSTVWIGLFWLRISTGHTKQRWERLGTELKSTYFSLFRLLTWM